MSTESQQQIAEHFEIRLENQGYLGITDKTPPKVVDRIRKHVVNEFLSAIERATEELQAANDNLFKIARKHCVENKKLKDEWPEGYDLTSFLHGDDPAAQPHRSVKP